MSDQEELVASAEEEEEENGLALDEDESQELQEVFSTVFPQYLVPLEELVGQLLEEESSPEIVEGLRGAVAPLVAAAASVGVTRLKHLLEDFQRVIEQVAGSTSLDEQARNEVIDVFYRLKEGVQNLGGGEPREQPLEKAQPGDFVARLSAIEGVTPESVQKILAAGISSAELVAGASVDEIAAVTGLSEEIAARVHESFGGRPSPRKKPPGGGDPPRSPPAPGQVGGNRSPPVAPASKASAVAQDSRGTLQGRLALLSLVRERIRLEEALEREQEATRRVALEAERLSDGMTVLKTRLHQRHEELSHLQELTAASEAALQRLRGEVARVHGSGTGLPGRTSADAIQSLESRLQRLKRRMVTRTG